MLYAVLECIYKDKYDVPSAFRESVAKQFGFHVGVHAVADKYMVTSVMSASNDAPKRLAEQVEDPGTVMACITALDNEHHELVRAMISKFGEALLNETDFMAWLTEHTATHRRLLRAGIKTAELRPYQAGQCGCGGFTVAQPRDGRKPCTSCSYHLKVLHLDQPVICWM